MNPSIPASRLVSSIPGVLAPGGNALSLNAVFVTTDPSIPFGVAQAFPDATAVEDWFGPTSQEALHAAIYFSGFANASALPSTLYFYQRNLTAAIAGYARGGSMATTALSAIQALSGTLTVVIDGMTVVTPNINLAAANSFTNAAALVQTGLQTAGNIFSGTGSVTTAQTSLDITAVTSGTVYVGMPVSGTGIPPGTTIEAFGTGTGGIGTYTLSAAATATGAGEPITGQTNATVTYDDLRDAFVITSATTGATSSVGFPTAGTLSTGLKLTSTTGAVLSAGAGVQTPTEVCDGIVGSTQNWATLHLVQDPDNGAAGGTIKLEFAQWISANSPAGQERFFYPAWDSDQTPASNGSDNACFAQALKAAAYNGTMPIYDQTNGDAAAFVAGMVASINFNAPGGRIAFDAKTSNAALLPSVTSGTAAENLEANGYNYYGAFGTANQVFQEFQTGSMPGEWVWADPYVDQIWLNCALQLALMVYKQQANQVPYNKQGNAGIRNAMLPTIQQAVSNGVIQAGVVLSGSQQQAVNSATGNANAATILTNTGWILTIGVATPTTRGQRGSPPISLYYTDGGSVRVISFNSVDVE